MQIIIVGLGKIGYALAQKLSEENHDLIVIDQQPQKISRALNSLDVGGLAGNGAGIEVLLEAEVGEADLLIAVTGMDETNLLCCLTAKKIGVKRTIARVRKPEYCRQIELMKDELGLSAIVNPELGAAEEISRILRLPAAAGVDTFFDGRVELVEFRLNAGSILDGVPLSQFRERIGQGVLVCTAERSGVIQIPKGDYILKIGDRINVAGKPTDIYHFFHRIGVLKKKIKNVMIVGGSRIAVYVTQSLMNAGIHVKMVEKDEKRCQEIKALLPKLDLIHGDGTQTEVLKEEKIEKMDAFIALTGSDEENIIVSMYADSLGVAKVIVKVNEQHIIDMMEGSPLDSFIQPKNVCSEQILQYVRAIQNAAGSSSMKTLYNLSNGRIEALGFQVLSDSQCIGWPLKALPIRKEVLVASISRGKETFIPDGNDEIKTGDHIVVITSKHGMNELDDILEA